MKDKIKIEQLQLILVLLVWVLIFAIPLLFGDTSSGIRWNNILRVWREYSILFVIFLTNRFILMPYLFFKGKRILYFTSTLGLILLFSSLLFMARSGKKDLPGQRIHPPAREAPHLRRPPMRPKAEPFVPPAANLFIMSILLVGFDSGLLFFSKWMQSEQKKLKAEKESIKNKMAFLQNQISPHFFMNTLNNIHALVDINTEEAKDAIIKLSRMMDYMLYESQTSLISLKHEIDFINSYVDLMKLRFTNDVDIKLQWPNNVPYVKIPPLLTISFIENAFKYGISYESPSFVHIHIEADETSFAFNIKNSINASKEKRKNSGIGIQNTRNRLELIYGKNYELTIDDKNDKVFEVNLNLQL